MNKNFHFLHGEIWITKEYDFISKPMIQFFHKVVISIWTPQMDCWYFFPPKPTRASSYSTTLTSSYLYLSNQSSWILFQALGIQQSHMLHEAITRRIPVLGGILVKIHMTQYTGISSCPMGECLQEFNLEQSWGACKWPPQISIFYTHPWSVMPWATVRKAAMAAPCTKALLHKFQREIRVRKL